MEINTMIMYSTMCSIGSIALGLVACILPLFAITSCKRLLYLCSVLSLSACAVSLLLQLVEINLRVQAGDWSALSDTTETLQYVAAGLVCMTIVVNAMALVSYYRNRNRRQGTRGRVQ